MKPRRPAESDFQVLGPFLDEAFSSYRDATRFAPFLTEFFRKWMWESSLEAVVVHDEEGLLGAAMAGERQASFHDSLRCIHIGPVAVRPDSQRQRIGTRLMRAVEDRATESSADLLTLTTEAAYGAHHLYAAEGYTVLEAYRPLVALLAETYVEPRVAMEIPLAELLQSPPAWPSRDGVISESIGPCEFPPELLCRAFRTDGAALITLCWPVVSRIRGVDVEMRATQIIRRYGSGPALEDTVAAAISAAREDKSNCIYALPSVATGLTEFSHQGAPLVFRMVKPVSERGRHALERARGYDECCPAP